MEYVIDQGIRVSNNSWGGGAYSEALYDVIEASQAIGHVFIAAAGNTSDDIDVDPHYPASYDLPNIISVAATDNDDNLAVFPSGNMSNYGPVGVDLGAPGLHVYSAKPGTIYGYSSGTSMAAPHVSGVVAQLMSRYPVLTWSETKQLVLSTVRPVDSLDGITVTGGVLNLWDALRDCNLNGVLDDQDIAGGTSADCAGDGIPDECERDCNGNGMADSCDILEGTSADCNGNGIPDECLALERDCNGNLVPDACDISAGTSEDCTANGVPDECEPRPDCNDTGTADFNDICNGVSEDCNTNAVPDECDLAAGTSADCNANAIPDECDIAGPTSEDCTGNGIPDECEPDCNGNGVADSCDIAGATSTDCNGNTIPDECDIAGDRWPDADDNGVVDSCEVPILYVNAAAAGAQTGITWTEAFTDLQDAMHIAANPPHVVLQIWVAQGVYRPAPAGGDRSDAFGLATDVGVYGGFAGGESSIQHRDAQANETILSGDLNGDDVPAEFPDGPSYADNSVSVVTATDVSANTVVDGIIVTAGAYGLYNTESSPNVRNCTFTGTFNYGVRNLSHSAPTFTECNFVNNAGRALGSVGGGNDPFLINCRITGNLNGGLYNVQSDPILVNCVISGNSTPYNGGAMLSGGVGGSHPVLINCTIINNVADYWGGGLYNSDGSYPSLTNCILWNNDYTGSPGIGETDQIHGPVGEINYNCVHGWTGDLGGTGNNGDDPLFLVSRSRGIGGVPADGSNASGARADDYHLSPYSPCIDHGDPDFVPIYGGNLDIDNEPRVMGGRVDIGADEVDIDCNDNGVNDLDDIAGGTSTDCNGNLRPDECDIAIGFSEDCTANLMPDECEAVPDCNGNGAADYNDLCAGTSVDCTGNGVPDECDIAEGTNQDCNDNGVPDVCDISAGTAEDCNMNTVPDACDIAEGTSNDVDHNGTPDECEDCNGNAVPDMCDIDCGPPGGYCNLPGCGASEDVNSNNSPDECESNAPALPPWPDDVPKNRYIAFDPNNSGYVAFEMELTGCAQFPESVGIRGWVSEPDADGISRVVGEPFFSNNWPSVVMVGDCEIVPAAAYAVETVADPPISPGPEPLILSTTPEPTPKKWADVVGAFEGAAWTGPDGVVNMDDVMAAVQRFQQLATAPALSWVDLEPETPNAVLNFTDILQLVQGFKGEPYPFREPGLCLIAP